ncbi:MAG: GxxExxY protein [Ignavibacteria bacterium]|jgi:GxxExxY protein
MELIYKKESYDIIGCCMEVHKNLGKGFNELVYGDALELEFNSKKISYEREKHFEIKYKNYILKHHYKADFVIYDKIILEIKAIEGLTNSNIKQTLNYLASSQMKLGILVNFGEDSLKYKRIVL